VALPQYKHVTFNRLNFGPGMNSISVNPDVATILDFKARKASAAKFGITPARFVCWVELDVSGVPVAVVNCHFISKPNSDPWRQAQWQNNLRVLLEVVAELEARGFRTVVLGDFNKATWDLIDGMVEPRFEPLTVDRIGVPSDVKATARLGTNGGSNHRPVIATLSITKE
jgi:endonuclease/exonuclease/phosphatase family metal-dependent hydrolase